LRPLDLAIAHVGVLGLLSARGDLSQQQLIEILEVDKFSMAYLIDELEKQGLAERRPAPGDRRAYAVHLHSGWTSAASRGGGNRKAHRGRVSQTTDGSRASPLDSVAAENHSG
jgi:hypothetical protein